MKNMKKLASILLALVMVFALTANAFAAGDNSITVNGAEANETYNLYKMLDLSVDLEKNAYTYTVNAEWAAFFAEGGAEYVVIDDQGYVSWAEGKDGADAMAAFGKAAAKFATENNIPVVASNTPTADGTFTFDALEAGYYLITSTNGTLAIVDTTPTNPDAVVNEKNDNPTLDKDVQEDSNSSFGDANSAQIGDTVEFKVTITAKKGAKNYVMHDKMDAGLTFNPDSVEITGLTKGTDYTVVTEGLSDNCTFEIQFTQSYLDTLTADTVITVTYNAVLNENANIVTGEKNDAQITWGDKNGTEWSETVTKTYQFSVLKYVQGDQNKAPLADAVFQLKDANGNVVNLVKVSDTEYRVANGAEEGAVDSFTTVADGAIVIKGVDLDDYTLVETKAPDGYNMLKEPVNVTVNENNELVVDVPNAAGTELPSTGGMGTTIFYVVGSVLALAAIVLLISKKRMSAKG